MLQDYGVPVRPDHRSHAGYRTADDGEIRRLYDAIKSEKVAAEFDAEAGKWGHCEGVALSQYDQLVHDWLDRVLVS